MADFRQFTAYLKEDTLKMIIFSYLHVLGKIF